MRQSKSFLVLNCEVSSEWDSFTFANIFVKYFSSPADEDKLYEKWDICNLAKGDQLPNINTYNSIIITGSYRDIKDRNDDPWFDMLANIILSAYASGSPNIYGGCYGCQIIAHVLGGVVGLNSHPDQAVHSAWSDVVLRTDRVDLAPSLRAAAAAQLQAHGIETRDDAEISMLEAHSYCVQELPPNGHGVCLVASTPANVNEVFAVGNMAREGRKFNIMACQGHPEFSDHARYAIADRIWPLVCSRRKCDCDCDCECEGDLKCGLKDDMESGSGTACVCMCTCSVAELQRSKEKLSYETTLAFGDAQEQVTGRYQGLRVTTNNTHILATLFRDFLYDESWVQPALFSCHAEGHGQGEELVSCPPRYELVVMSHGEDQGQSLQLLNSRCPMSNKPVARDALPVFKCELGSFAVGFCNPHCRDKFETQQKQEQEQGLKYQGSEKYEQLVALFKSCAKALTSVV